MKPILFPKDIGEAGFRSGDWTVVIAAGGTGSRLGSTVPKALFPVLGRPMVDWVLDACFSCLDDIVLVVSPAAETEIRRHVTAAYPGAKIRFTVQPKALGTADAVSHGLASVKTKGTVVVWCDQVTVRAQTLESCLRAHALRGNAKLTFPSVLRAEPYVWFDRDDQGKLLKVGQRRESETAPATGESDCGFFLFDTARLREVLSRKDPTSQAGQLTKEINLLTLLPNFERAAGETLTLRIENTDETLGVNSPQEVREAEKILRGRPWSGRKAKKSG